MAIDLNELTPEALEALRELAEKSGKNGKDLSTVIREAVDAWLKQSSEQNGDEGDIEYAPDARLSSIESWEAYFADPARPSADFMKDRYDPPPQARDLF